jgi:hypothetical protein
MTKEVEKYISYVLGLLKAWKRLETFNNTALLLKKKNKLRKQVAFFC